jgi:hypothetical protein
MVCLKVHSERGCCHAWRAGTEIAHLKRRGSPTCRIFVTGLQAVHHADSAVDHLLAVHGILRILLGQSHGATIFPSAGRLLLILTMYRPGSCFRKVAVSMLVPLFLVVTYLMAAEAFLFLYSAPGEADHYFKAAALPGWLFDSLVLDSPDYRPVGPDLCPKSWPNDSPAQLGKKIAGAYLPAAAQPALS